MRILFIGAVAFSARALRELIAMRAKVVGICTLEESKFHSDHEDLTPIAEQAGIPVLYTSNVNSIESLAWIRGLKPDVIFCFGWSRLIHSSLLRLPPLGVIGFHPAALPANRGRHPLIWALVLGLKETASSFFFMDEGADSGDLLSQSNIPIDLTDDAGSLYRRVTDEAIEQLREFVPRLAAGEIQRIPQDHRLANVWRKRGIEDGVIDWRMAAEGIHNLVRGLTRPYVGAHFDYAEQQIKVWKTTIEQNVPLNFEPGKVLAVDDCSVLIKAGSGAIRLLEYTPKIQLKPGDYL
ncbi:methionyl-tRNA formyltransferase [Alphaproteobacteria bacterium LSUCC0744]